MNILRLRKHLHHPSKWQKLWTLTGLTFAMISGMLQWASAQQGLEGVVYGDDNLPLPFAVITIFPDSQVVTANASGEFSAKPLPQGHYDLEIKYVGYATQSVHVHLVNGISEQLNIYLSQRSTQFSEVTISDEHAKQENSLSHNHVTARFMEEQGQGTFAKSIEALPGISAINVGVGIAKPVIRGLSSNRIIINHQGIKQESQQWGNDHGLEIDQFDVERVEIIKGPASLQYGSDGLGGVINILPPKLLPRNSISGSITGIHKTNNQHWGGSAHIGINVKDWFIQARYTHQDFADYRVPATLFEYNSFTLPIENERLKNTAGREHNVSLTAGISRAWGITRLHYSRYSLEAGLFSGAVGIPRSYALTHDGNYRDIDAPKQEVKHQRLTFSQLLFFGNNHLAIDVGYQHNLRQEFSNPEFHSIPSSQIDFNDQLALELTLQTFSVNVHYEQNFDNHSKFIQGGSVQWQDNQRGGFEFLLPDFQTFRAGIFGLLERELARNWIANGGLRLDYGTNQNDFYKQYVWDSNENITDSLIANHDEDLFFNWSASAGSNWILQDGRWNVKLNIGKSFRVPYPVETSANGIHHGTFRHERGTPGLQSEHGYQLDASARLQRKRFILEWAVYFNYFDNYIYLGPTTPAQFSTLPEAGQIFQYRQDDAIYTGFELNWEWKIGRGVQIKQVADFVQSYNVVTKLALPFTPQPALKTAIRYDYPSISNANKATQRANFLKNTFLEIGHQYHMAAEGTWRIDRSERPTPAYQLWNISSGIDIEVAQQPISIKFQVQNVLDKAYLAHLSRYRIINVPEQGRNFVLLIKIPFKYKF